MTTIAYDGQTVAYDSRLSKANGIMSDKYSKLMTVQGVQFIFCGVPSDKDLLPDAYFNNQLEGTAEISALIIDQGKVYEIACYEDIEILEVTGMPWAIGSGSDHALTAMDLGQSAREAVKSAMKRDMYTGGKIHTLEV